MATIPECSIGARFGRLLVISAPVRGNRRVDVRCDCGTEKAVTISNLGKETRSCGCIRTDARDRVRISAGDMYVRLTVVEDWRAESGPLKCICACGKRVEMFAGIWRRKRSCGCIKPTYDTWRGMMDRCTNPNHAKYEYYGGRGVTVCERWRDFNNFYADMGQRPDGRTLDRIDGDRNYEPGNCRWATKAEQLANRRPYRRPTMCQRRLHELTPDNVIPVRGGRLCKSCRREYMREYRLNGNKAPSLSA
jgi:hypothetical protein